MSKKLDKLEKIIGYDKTRKIKIMIIIYIIMMCVSVVICIIFYKEVGLDLLSIISFTLFGIITGILITLDIILESVSI